MPNYFLPSCIALAVVSILWTQALAQQADFVHDCDTFAAHPDDQNRWASGVGDEDVVPGPAVKFCTDAVAAHPDIPRFQFQLGRALWAAQRFAEGNDVFLALQDQHDYPPAYAYLGAAFALGLGGVEVDNDMALQLYEVAAASGFSPAREALGAIPVPSPAPTNSSIAAVAPPIATLPPVEAPLDLTGFFHPKVITALNHGDLAALSSAGLGTARIFGVAFSKLDLYLVGFDEEFSGSLNFKDPACVQIHNPRVTQLLERRVLSAATGGGSIEGASANALGMLLKSMQQLQSGDMMGIVDQQKEVELTRIEGSRDAAKLILGYGCLNDNVRRIYANLAASVLNTAPILSGAQQQKQAAAAAKAQQEREAEEVRRAAAQAQERQHALLKRASDACLRQYSDDAFCTCLMTGLEPLGVDTAAWQTLGASFDKIVTLRSQYSTIPDVIRECRQRTAAN